MGDPIKIAACQVPDIREDPDMAMSWIETFADKAQAEAVRLLCFPECFLQGYLLDETLAHRHALNLESLAFAAVLERLAPIAPALVFGLIEVDRGVLFNTAVVVERGRLLGRYRKTHVHSKEIMFQPGDSYPVFDVDGLRFGVNICYDMRFPEAAAALARQGAVLVLAPSNNMLERASAEKWKLLHNELRALRAKESSVWLASSDVTGELDGQIAFGPTSIINPEGKIVAQVPLSEVGLVTAEIPGA